MLPRFQFIYFLACCFLMITYQGKAQGVTIAVHNKTGFDLDSVALGSIYLGPIKQDSFACISELKELVLQGNIPLFLPSAYLDGQSMGTKLVRCGTGSRKIKSGDYAFDLKMYQSEKGVRLYLEVCK